jgi:hypothetical protein
MLLTGCTSEQQGWRVVIYKTSPHLAVVGAHSTRFRRSADSTQYQRAPLTLRFVVLAHVAECCLFCPFLRRTCCSYVCVYLVVLKLGEHNLTVLSRPHIL